VAPFQANNVAAKRWHCSVTGLAKKPQAQRQPMPSFSGGSTSPAPPPPTNAPALVGLVRRGVELSGRWKGRANPTLRMGARMSSVKIKVKVKRKTNAPY